MLVFDTAKIAVPDRAEAVVEAMRVSSGASGVVLRDPGKVHLRISRSPFGPVQLVHVQVSAMRTHRRPGRGRADRPPVVALVLGHAAGGLREQHGHASQARPGLVDLLNLDEPYQSRIPEGADGWSIQIPFGELGLSRQTVVAARSRVHEHPLNPVFSAHLRSLAVQARRQHLTDDPLLGAATVALARALISAAAVDGAQARQALADTLVMRVQAYVREHLADRTLTPDGIAAAHHVSVRHLYQVFSGAGLRLEQWIIAERLAAARWELARPSSRNTTIAAVAYHWGFANASHFTHRFRAAYGQTPRDWQNAASRTQ